MTGSALDSCDVRQQTNKQIPTHKQTIEETTCPDERRSGTGGTASRGVTGDCQMEVTCTS